MLTIVIPSILLRKMFLQAETRQNVKRNFTKALFIIVENRTHTNYA